MGLRDSGRNVFSRGAAACNSQGREPLEPFHNESLAPEGRHFPLSQRSVAAPRLNAVLILSVLGLTPQAFAYRRSAAEIDISPKILQRHLASYSYGQPPATLP